MQRNSLTALIGAGAAIAAMQAHAALELTDAGLGVYDTTNDVTWTADANLMRTQAAKFSGGEAAFVAAVIAASNGVVTETLNAFDPTGTYTLSASDFWPAQNNGAMTWWGAQAWVHYLNSINYGGSNQWTLPTTVDNAANLGYTDGGTGNPSPTSSQMAELFYGDLGQVANATISVTHNGSYSLFSNMQVAGYWSGTEFGANPGGAWTFTPLIGYQNVPYKNPGIFALAVCRGRLDAASLVNNYNASARQLTIPLATVGTAHYSNLVVTVGGVVSVPSGGPAQGTVDTYDPVARQLTVPAVTVGTQTLYNGVVGISGLVSVDTVSGADSFDGTDLSVSSVQVKGGATYANVVISPGQVLGVAGGMPQASQDQYDPQTHRLLIPAVGYAGKVYTNVTITVGRVLSVNGVPL